jgi:DNA-binding MarR family transcriptional regulator
MDRLERVAKEFRSLIGFMKTEYFRPAEHITRTRLSPAQFHALSTVFHHGALPMSDLAAELQVSKQQLTALIGKLMGNHLVERRHDSLDRRVVIIDITPAGRTTVETLGKEIKMNLMNRLRLIPEDDLEDLEQLLIRMNEILRKRK